MNMNTEKCKLKCLKRLVVAALLITASVVVWAQTIYRITIIGDSTVCNYAESKYPMMGWGQVLGLFFENGSVTINNAAIGGRSSRSFYQEGRWSSVVSKLQKGEYVFIQFGHNDRDFSKEERYTDTSDYKEYLRKYVNESRAKGAIPVLVSPMNMNAWNGTSVREVFCEGANNYRGAMINVSKELNVPFIDLEKKSVEQQKRVGDVYNAEFIHLGLDKGEYPNYPDGSTDRLTHFQEMGANLMAKFVCDGIRELNTNADMSKLVAVLKSLHKVNVSSNKANIGMITESGNSFPSGTTITVKVKPSSGEKFIGWVDNTGKTVTTEKRHTFKMGDSDVTFTAMFEGGTSMVTLSASVESGNGTVSITNGSFSVGAEVSLSAVADNGYIFDHWDGDITGTENPVKVTMDKNKAIKAYFVEDSRPQFTVKTQVLGSGTITQLPSGAKLAEGTRVSFEVVPNKGWKFVGWSGSSSGTETEYSVSVDKNIDLTAKFMPENISVYEAEDAIIGNGISENTNSGFSGDGYANVNNEIGSSIEIPVYIKSAGLKTVTFIYANGSTASRSFSVSLNGSDETVLEFGSTGNWTTWLPKEANFTFQEGYNAIKLVSPVADGGPNIDKIEIDQDVSVVVRNCSLRAPMVKFRSGKLEIVSAELRSAFRVEILALNGQKVFAQTVMVEGSKKTVLPIKNLRNGSYIVKITSKNFSNMNQYMSIINAK